MTEKMENTTNHSEKRDRSLNRSVELIARVGLFTIALAVVIGFVVISIPGINKPSFSLKDTSLSNKTVDTVAEELQKFFSKRAYPNSFTVKPNRFSITIPFATHNSHHSSVTFETICVPSPLGLKKISWSKVSCPRSSCRKGMRPIIKITDDTSSSAVQYFPDPRHIMEQHAPVGASVCVQDRTNHLQVAITAAQISREYSDNPQNRLVEVTRILRLRTSILAKSRSISR